MSRSPPPMPVVDHAAAPAADRAVAAVETAAASSLLVETRKGAGVGSPVGGRDADRHDVTARNRRIRSYA